MQGLFSFQHWNINPQSHCAVVSSRLNEQVAQVYDNTTMQLLPLALQGYEKGKSEAEEKTTGYNLMSSRMRTRCQFAKHSLFSLTPLPLPQFSTQSKSPVSVTPSDPKAICSGCPSAAPY